MSSIHEIHLANKASVRQVALRHRNTPARLDVPLT